MQVVSGPVGRRRVHFEAPPALKLEAEVARVNRNVPVEVDAEPVKAGRRLHSRYPLVTRYSETLPPTFPQVEAEEKAEVVVFPA